jgi:hypothetical protein
MKRLHFIITSLNTIVPLTQLSVCAQGFPNIQLFQYKKALSVLKNTGQGQAGLVSGLKAFLQAMIIMNGIKNTGAITEIPDE